MTFAMYEINYMKINYMNFIEKVEITRKTKHCVWRGKNRHARESYYQSYHDTWEEARQALIVKFKKAISDDMRKIERLNENLIRNRDHYDQLREMKEPK